MRRTLLALALLCGTSTAQRTWTVPGDFPTIGAALAAAGYGDTVLVGPGTYHESALTLGGKDLILRGRNGAAATVIDAQNAGRILELVQGEGPETRIEGLTFRRGHAPPTGGASGGAILCMGSSPTIAGCRFEYNTAGNVLGHGGALFAEQGRLVIEDCIFSDNRAGSAQIGGDGGAIAADRASLVVRRCAFLRNETGQGQCFQYEGAPSGKGGACRVLRSEAHFEDCVFRENRGADGVPCSDIGGRGGDGGAIVARDGSMLWIDRCRFVANAAGDGGSSVTDSGFPGIGGAVFADTALVTSSLFQDNRPGVSFDFGEGGGAALMVEDAWVTGCTFAAHLTYERSVIETPASPPHTIPRIFIANSVLWGNTLPCIPTSGFASVRDSIIEGGFAGQGNLASDPLFADPASGNFRLQAGSPAIDTAYPFHPLAGPLDVDGTPRLQGAGLDRGCHERPCLPGTDDPLVLRATVDGNPATGPCDVPLRPFEVALVEIRGVDDAFVGSLLYLGADLFPHGVAPAPTSVPGLHLDLSGAAIGSTVVPGGGLRALLSHAPPAALSGMTLRLQAFLLDTGALNGAFALSPAMDLVFQ